MAGGLVGNAVAERDAGAMRGTRAWMPAVAPWVHGVRLAAAVCLALLIAFWLQLDNAYWAATSASIVAQPALGASLRKARFRAIGTVVGGVLIVLITAALPQNHAGYLAVLTLWVAGCAFFASFLPNFASYAAALAGYTAVVIFGSIIEDPGNVFMMAVWRTTEIGIGIFSAAIVHSITAFGDARERLTRSLSEIARAIAGGVVRSLQLSEETMELRTLRRRILARVIALDPLIDETLGEPSHVRHGRGVLHATQQSLFVALSAWRSIGNHLPSMSAPARAAAAEEIMPALRQLATLDWHGDRVRAPRLCAEALGSLCERGGEETSSSLVVECARRIFGALESVTGAIGMIVRGERPRPALATARSFYIPDPANALIDSLRTLLAVTVAEGLWVITEWPNGPVMITFTAVTVILFARQAEQAYGRALEYAVGSALAGICAVVLDLAILPAVHGGMAMLSVALAVVFVPLGALSAGRWYPALFGAAAANLMPMLAIEDVPHYEADRVFNTALAVLVGVLIGATFLRLIPPLTPERRTARLLARSLAELKSLAAGRLRDSAESWRRRLSHRLTALPPQATLEESAELLAVLAAGESALRLRATAGLARPELLARALAALAGAAISDAREALAELAAAQSPHSRNGEPGGERRRIRDRRRDPTPGSDPAVEAILMSDALGRHPRFFATEA